MEEIEVPVEHLQEEIHHHATHGAENERWISIVALVSAFLAVLAAVAALLAGHHANEAMIEQIQSSDKWSHYQAKSIKATVLKSKMDLLKEMGKVPPAEDAEKLKEYKKEQEDIQSEADEKEKHSKGHLARHEIIARGVTMSQVAIAVAAISVLTRRRRFFYFSIGLGILGSFFLIQGQFFPI